MKTYHGTGPIPDSNSKTAECFSIQEITWLVKYTYLWPPFSRPGTGVFEKKRTWGLFQRHAAMTSLIFCPLERIKRRLGGYPITK